MDPHVRDLMQPRAYLVIGLHDIDRFTLACLQWIEERSAHVPVKSLDFAFGLRAVRCAKFQGDTVVLCDFKQIRIVAVASFAVRIALDDDRFRIIAQHLLGNAIKELERAL